VTACNDTEYYSMNGVCGVHASFSLAMFSDYSLITLVITVNSTTKV